jgi:hypothetical protein
MKITLMQSLEILKTGDTNLAWQIARQDEGLLPEVTKDFWLSWALKVLSEEENN